MKPHNRAPECTFIDIRTYKTYNLWDFSEIIIITESLKNRPGRIPNNLFNPYNPFSPPTHKILKSLLTDEIRVIIMAL